MRCRATNLCVYCRKMYTRETAKMLVLHAERTGGPSVWVVLTAREHLTRPQCTRHLTQLRRAARLRWPTVEWFVQVEFQRRGALHLNLLVRGVPSRDADAFLGVLSGVWCSRVDALPVGQWCEAIGEGRAVAVYVSKLIHGLKASQAPPIGWAGHRTSQTMRYFDAALPVLRAEARRALRMETELWRRTQRLSDQEREQGVDLPDEVWSELLAEARTNAQAALEHADSVTWRPIRLVG
jgi:hypothetical protein